MHKNFKNIDKTVFGRGCFDMLDEIIAPERRNNKGFFLFVVDNYFKGKELENELIDKENVLSLIDSKELLKMIQELSPVYKMIFNMYVFEDMGHREIAKVLNITEGTSRKNLSDARNVLKKKINQTMALDKKIAHNDRRANG